MKLKFFAVTVIGLALLLLGVTAPVAAQEEDEPVYTKHDEDDWEKSGKWAFGIGFGMVNLDEEALDDDVETYWMANLRMRLGDGGNRWSGKRVRGYLEPELGYWEKSERGASASDLLLGLNVIGVIPADAVDFFIGGGLGIHFLDADASFGGVNTSESDEALGVNAQFGVDVGLSRSTSLFAVGRFDIIDDSSDSLEAKAYVGIRFSK